MFLGGEGAVWLIPCKNVTCRCGRARSKRTFQKHLPSLCKTAQEWVPDCFTGKNKVGGPLPQSEVASSQIRWLCKSAILALVWGSQRLVRLLDRAVNCIQFPGDTEMFEQIIYTCILSSSSADSSSLPPKRHRLSLGTLLSLLQKPRDLDTAQEHCKIISVSVGAFLMPLPAWSLLSGFTPLSRSLKFCFFVIICPWGTLFFVQKPCTSVFSYLFSPKFQPQICDICNMQGIFCVKDISGIF